MTWKPRLCLSQMKWKRCVWISVLPTRCHLRKGARLALPFSSRKASRKARKEAVRAAPTSHTPTPLHTPTHTHTSPTRTDIHTSTSSQPPTPQTDTVPTPADIHTPAVRAKKKKKSKKNRKKKTRLHADSLAAEEAQRGRQPRQGRRTGYSTPADLAAIDPKHNVRIKAGARFRFRHNVNVQMDYERVPPVIDPLNYTGLVPVGWVDEYFTPLPCKLCGRNTVKHTLHPGTLSREFVIQCTADDCEFYDSTAAAKLDGMDSMLLALTAECIRLDIGKTGFQNLMQIMGLKGVVSKWDDCAKTVYAHMKNFYDANNPTIHSVIWDTYRTVDPSKIDADGYLHPDICLDGTYSQRGKHGRYGITFVIDMLTGNTIDAEVTERCFECPDNNVATTTCTRDPVLHHGSSGQMEGVNASKLFRRSVAKHHMIYSTFVSDGDAKIMPKIYDAYKKVPSPTSEGGFKSVDILKKHCWNHFFKCLVKRLVAWAALWPNLPVPK
ncbi:unnamed protein product, partial [Meganyctiphanes norvegica]